MFQRPGRPVWYVKYLSVETLDWKSEATSHRLDDPAGKRKAVHYGEVKAAEFAKMGSVRRQEAWSAWVLPFLKGRGSDPLTVTSYKAAWSFLSTFLLERRVMAPAQLTYSHGKEFLAWRMKVKRHCGKTVSKNTAIGNLKVLSLIMGEAVKRGFALMNPVLRMGIRRDPPKEKVELTQAEVATIRAAVVELEAERPITERWMTVSFEIAYYQGCRLSETRVAMTDVDEARGEIRFFTKGRGDGRREHLTALHPALVPLIKQLRAAGATHTCTLPRMAAKEWWALRQKLKLGHTCFHSTRVGVISEMARKGVPEQQAMRYVNHSSVSVHRIYQKLNVRDLQACVTALNFSPGSATTGGKE